MTDFTHLFVCLKSVSFEVKSVFLWHTKWKNVLRCRFNNLAIRHSGEPKPFFRSFFPSEFPNKPRPRHRHSVWFPAGVFHFNPDKDADVCTIVSVCGFGGGQRSEQKGAWGHRRHPGGACSAGTDHFKRDVQRGGKTDGGHKAQTWRGGASGTSAHFCLKANK